MEPRDSDSTNKGEADMASALIAQIAKSLKAFQSFTQAEMPTLLAKSGADNSEECRYIGEW